MSVRICRAGWNREKALHSNYASNRFQSNPNEGFGRNAAPPKVSKLIPNHLCRGAAGLSEVALLISLSCKLNFHMNVLQAAEEDNDSDAAEAESDDGKRSLSLSLPHKSVQRTQASITQLLLAPAVNLIS
jgi:hypothetical protein